MKQDEENSSNNLQNPNHEADFPTMEKLYENWFLEYASYVILERAIPAIEDGLKPVQRRILYSMYLIDDGRYNKVANIVGQTMQFHPHGDASITETIVGMGQKELLLDTQGNWGDVRTGDSAAAARYIEVRLSPFGKEILYSPGITTWQLSYDGRKKEPTTLPTKFPLLLMQGVEGIAVGLATKILPHNFIELVQASIDLLKGKEINLIPDFPTGGLVDCSHYNEGKRGGKVRVRAAIEIRDKQTLAITQIPYGVTTSSLIDSIIKAHEKGKIKIKNVTDNTAENVEILISLFPGQLSETVVDALYLFTDCEVNYAPSGCVIKDAKPAFLSVNELLAYSVNRTMSLLRQELTLQQKELEEKLFFASLEKIFIENKIYKEIELCKTWEDIVRTLTSHLTPYVSTLYRPLVEEDLIRLMEIKIKRISQYDCLRAEKLFMQLQADLNVTTHHLYHLKDYTINWYDHLLKKYSKGRERKTILTTFDPIEQHAVTIKNHKLYVNRKQGFIGYGLKSEEFIEACSDKDDVIIIHKDGKCLLTKVTDKAFVGKDILHVSIYEKSDKNYYNLIYVDGSTGVAFTKRFQLLGIARDKLYDLTLGKPGSRIIYLNARPPNVEAETLTVLLSPISRTSKKKIEFNFAQLPLQGRAAKGRILTKHSIYKIQLKKEDPFSLKETLELWYDTSTGQVGPYGQGQLVGLFNKTDKLLLVFKKGYYIVASYPLSFQLHPEEVAIIEKLKNLHLLSVIYYHNKLQKYFVKRFIITTTNLNKKYDFFFLEADECKLILVTSSPSPKLQLHYAPTPTSKDTRSILYDLEKVAIKTVKAKGTLLSQYGIKEVVLWDE